MVSSRRTYQTVFVGKLQFVPVHVDRIRLLAQSLMRRTMDSVSCENANLYHAISRLFFAIESRETLYFCGSMNNSVNIGVHNIGSSDANAGTLTC